MWCRYIFIFLILNKSFFCEAQKKYYLQYNMVEKNTAQNLNLESSFANRIICSNYISTITYNLKLKGYVTASIDSIQYATDTAIISLFVGYKYIWENIDISKNDINVLTQCGWNNNMQKNENFQPEKIFSIQQKMLDYYQNNGYPFAKIQLDSIVINKDKITASLITDKGALYKIDSIKLFGTANISTTFLQKHLNIINGSLYRKNILDAIPKKIQELPYLQQQYNYNLTMLSTSSIVNVYLQPRKSSIINVLLGVIPAPNPNGLAQAQKSKLFLSGDANILLNNAIGTGETIGLTYQQLSINSRRINLQFKQPYIFKSDYGFDIAFEIYNRDSAYLNLHAQVGSSYNLGDNKTGRLFFELNKTNTFPDTATIKATKKLGDNIDIKQYNLGFEYQLNTTNFQRNPTSGNELITLLAFGTKKILINSGISTIKDQSFNYVGLYDTINKSTYQFKLKANAAHYFKIRKQTVLKTAIQAGVLLSQNYFKNELFQIGGFKILRGFDEESQFCNQYAIATAEYRFIIGAESFLYVFTDGGYTKNEVNKTINHTYFGTGLGLNFATKSGVFNLSFAIGTRNDIPLGFKQAKLHFGYVNVF